MVAAALISTRELHSRSGDGIQVRLLWCEHDQLLWVSVIDFRKGEEFCLEVRDRTQALDVFHHPYAYAAHYGIEARARTASTYAALSIAA